MTEKYVRAVEKYRELILKTERQIWENPETGFKEYKTANYMEEAFEALGYDLVRAGNIPGFYTILDTGRPGPEVLILGELDSLICPNHPEADPVTGAVHCCGHNAQCAALLGVAGALKEPEILQDLCGRIRLCAVPAEELIEIEYRKGLVEEGKIRYLGGKTEFLHRGYFDGVDIAFMVHTTGGENFFTNLGSVGCISKRVIYKGKASHAGGSPWNGCNALYAATLGLNAINSIRETFREPDIIRVHPIMTHGGEVVNAIPERAVLESFVRGSNYEAIQAANQKVNRALCGAALSLGANVEIQDNPGYAPLRNSDGMIQLAGDAAKEIGEIPFVKNEGLSSGSTDMGDLSQLMPVIHPYAPGAQGMAHGADYRIADPELACVASAKWQVAMVSLLLKDGARRATEIIDSFVPTFASKEEYFTYVDSLYCEGDRISYEEGEARVRL